MCKNPNARIFIEFVEENHISLYKVARLSGISDGTLRAFRDTPGRVLSIPVATKVAGALEYLVHKKIHLFEMFSGSTPPSSSPDATSTSVDTLIKDQQIPEKGFRRADAINLPRDLPVFTARPCKGRSEILIVQTAVEVTARPPGLLGAHSAFALYVVTDHMAPRLEAGDLAYVHPSRPTSPGDDVLVTLIPDDGEKATAVIARLISGDNNSITLRHYTPCADFVISREKIDSICKILSINDIMT